ncbi:helix-turn-helix transcriptional regulator [Actinopolymorpha sp. B17G11]|uniref:helix-turn-helix domain-containing protein n=1 Tax=Actinopolymorpha sp. B17G11 TaxID=3160861 RepID=UPI0032E4BF9B
MRGAGDHLSVGERIAYYRARRGMTQAVLASLVNRSVDWVSKVERGDRQVRRLDVVVEVARALRVTPGDLLGQPVLVEDHDRQDDDVPAIRDALMTPRRLSRVLFDDESHNRPPSLRHTVQAVEVAWTDFQRGRLGQVITALPSLIRAAQALERDLDEQPTAGWAASARVHHLAATTLSKIGESDLAWIAAERAMGAADQADDPLVLASAARAGAHALLSIGRYEDALELGRAARAWLAPRVAENDAEALSLLGMLDLRMATAASRHQDRSTTSELLQNAHQAAQQLGRDANHWQTSFGPTNVMLHRISTALDLGDVAFVVEHGPRIQPTSASIERQVGHSIDVARALSYVAEDDAAIEILLTAERQAPHLVRHSAAVRETVKAIHRRSPVTTGRSSSPVLGLAERCRAIQ